MLVILRPFDKRRPRDKQAVMYRIPNINTYISVPFSPSSPLSNLDVFVRHILTPTLSCVDRLKCLMRLLEKGDVRTDVMQKNLKLAIRVLDTVYLDEAGR